jgi:uncharacterized protein (DUF736 family)
MSNYDNTNRGSLFINDRKESENHPDFKGSINIEGKDYWLSSWKKESKDGKKYMSLSVTAKDSQRSTTSANTNVSAESFLNDKNYPF